MAVAPNQDDHHSYYEDKNIATETMMVSHQGNFLLESQNHKRGRKQQFVSDGSRYAPMRNADELAREQAVDAVAESRHHQYRERPAIVFVRNQNQENRQEAEAQQRI